MSSVPVSLSNALFYVQTSGIPQELSDISVYDEVASKDISIYNFKTELNLIAKYDELKKASHFKEDNKSTSAAKFSDFGSSCSNNDDGTVKILTEKINSTNIQTDASSKQLNYNHDQVNPTILVSPPPLYQEARSKEAKLIQMMETTKQSRETCFFYLESMDWEYENAINMLNSLN